MRRPRLRRAGAVVAAVAAGLVMTGCGGGSPATAPAEQPAQQQVQFNQVDVDFAVALSQARTQALTITEMARTRARSEQISAQATQLQVTHGDQVDMLARWLQTWAAAGADTPIHGEGHDPDGPGMVPQSEIDRLAGLSGRKFDRAYTKLMASHDKGVRTLAGQVVDAGANPDASRLARQILEPGGAPTTAVPR